MYIYTHIYIQIQIYTQAYTLTCTQTHTHTRRHKSSLELLHSQRETFEYLPTANSVLTTKLNRHLTMFIIFQTYTYFISTTVRHYKASRNANCNTLLGNIIFYIFYNILTDRFCLILSLSYIICV